MYDQYDDNIYKRNTKKYTLNHFRRLEKTLLNIARKSCPKDTHNMAENAIYSVKIKNGFMIVWDDKFAYYLPYVNEGINPLFPNSEKVKRNKGFVDRSISFMLAYTFWDSGVEKHDKFFTNKFKKIKYNPENEVTRLGPLFLQKAHEIQKGELPVSIDKGTERAMTNMYKSVKKYMSKVNPSYSEIINSDIEYDFVDNQVYEINNKG